MPVYDPATGVCVDGINSDKTVNRNCGAESTIHTELSMLALDAHPDVARIATSLNRTTATDGLTVVEAESGTLTGSATVVTPPSAWTGSANWSGGKYVQAGAGDTITVTVPSSAGAHRILPIADLGNPAGGGTTAWMATAGSRTTNLGPSLNTLHAPQGIAPTTVYLQPQTLAGTAPAGTTTLTARIGGPVSLDAVMVQPVVSHLGLAGTNTSRDVYVNGTDQRATQQVNASRSVTVQRFDRFGQAVSGPSVVGPHAVVTVEAGGFTVVNSR